MADAFLFSCGIIYLCFLRGSNRIIGQIPKRNCLETSEDTMKEDKSVAYYPWKNEKEPTGYAYSAWQVR